MSPKSSSLTGPLWVIAVGILILGIGACFTAYMLWNRKQSSTAAQNLTPAELAELRELHRTNPAAYSERASASRSNILTKPGKFALDQSRYANLVETVSVPVQTTAPVVLPPPGAPAAVEPVGSGGALGRPLTATIFGRVTLRGTPAPEQPLPLDAMCGKLHNPAQPPTTRFYTVSSQGGLAEVFVYLHHAPRARKFPGEFNPNPNYTPVIDQVGCIYTPQVIGVEFGQPMIVRNSDPLLHNNHFTPGVPPYAEVNRAHPPSPGGSEQTYYWGQAEIFLRLKCDVHPWMFAYIGVMEHPFFAVTDTNGVFQFTAPSPGRYVIEAVHRKTHLRGGNGIKREIEVRAGEPLKVDFEVTVPVAKQ
jgi:hypothetical protein